MELIVAKEVMPNIEFNKEEIKANLNEQLQKYQGLVPTEETEQDAKKAKTEINKIITTIEDFRKSGKKKMEEPIKAFEKDCKDLVNLAKKTLKPIDDGLKEIEEQRKLEKTGEINEEIKKIIIEFGLDEKHGAQLSINTSYLNKTTKMNKIIADLKERAETLKKAQGAIVAGKELIIQTVEAHNKQLKVKHAVEPWLEMLSQNYDAGYIIGKINEKCFADLQAQIREEQEKVLTEQKQEETPKSQEITRAVAEEPLNNHSPVEGVFDEEGPSVLKMFDCGGDEVEISAYQNTILIKVGDEFIQLEDEMIDDFIIKVRKIQAKMRG